MVSFWSSSAVLQMAAKFEKLQHAEKQLIQFAHRYNNTNHKCSIEAFDTTIARSCIPSLRPNPKEGDTLIIHAIKVEELGKEEEEEVDSKQTSKKQRIPLVALHGYYNGAAYYFRNLAGLAKYYQTVYSVDWLGWGLSSRPDYGYLQSKNNNPTKETEEWFVESLEAWRQANGLEKMILVGHSMGGYMSVAYCEQYPQHVHQLILLSPVGVPDDSDPSFLERKARMTATFQSRTMVGVFQSLFDWTTVGTVLRRFISQERSYGMVSNYVQRRLPQIDRKDEQDAVINYLYYNAMLQGSGEYAIHAILNSNVLARHPLQDRIPQLQVKTVTCLYGQNDWMDMSGALTTQRICEQQLQQQKGKKDTPNVRVYMVPNAGHLLMLENHHGTTQSLIQAGGGVVEDREDNEPCCILLHPGTEAVPDSQVRRMAISSHYYERRQARGKYPPSEVPLD